MNRIKSVNGDIKMQAHVSRKRPRNFARPAGEVLFMDVPMRGGRIDAPELRRSFLGLLRYVDRNDLSADDVRAILEGALIAEGMA